MIVVSRGVEGSKAIEYPCLMESTIDDKVVLFTARCCGTVVQPAESLSSHKIGHCCYLRVSIFHHTFLKIANGNWATGLD